MEKEITIGFKAQSKTVVEEIKIRYILTEEEVSSKKYINDDLLSEVISLQEKAASHSRAQSLMK